MLAQSQPDIVEIEVSAEGQWRPAGSTERWRDITEDVSTAAITGPVVKQELQNGDAMVSAFIVTICLDSVSHLHQAGISPRRQDCPNRSRMQATETQSLQPP